MLTSGVDDVPQTGDVALVVGLEPWRRTEMPNIVQSGLERFADLCLIQHLEETRGDGPGLAERGFDGINHAIDFRDVRVDPL